MNTTIMLNDLTALINKIDWVIHDVTQVSTLESLALFDALVVLKSNIQSQHDKMVTGITPHRFVTTPRFKPALVVAHDEHTKEKVLTSINALQHPLFMRGAIAARDVE